MNKLSHGENNINSDKKQLYHKEIDKDQIPREKISEIKNSEYKKKKKNHLYKSDLKNIDIVFLDDSDKGGCIEKSEVGEKRRVYLSVNQRIQISFLLCLGITNVIIYLMAFVFKN